MFLASTRYGLIACRHLTRCYHHGKYVPAPDIADKYNMNVRALMPALRLLTKAGILRSRAGGKEPGFIFSRHPREITLLEVLIALEGDTSILCCKQMIPDLKCDCEFNTDCGVFNFFNDMVSHVKTKLSDITIEMHSKSVLE